MFGYNSVAQKNRWGTNMHSLSFTPNKTKAAAEVRVRSTVAPLEMGRINLILGGRRVVQRTI